MISLLYRIKKLKTKTKTNLINTENRLVAARGRVGEDLEKWVNRVERYKLPDIK